MNSGSAYKLCSNTVWKIIRLVFTSLIIFQTVYGQSLGVEPEVLLFPTINSVNNEREQDPDLFYEWDGDPRCGLRDREGAVLRQNGDADPR